MGNLQLLRSIGSGSLGCRNVEVWIRGTYGDIDPPNEVPF